MEPKKPIVGKGEKACKGCAKVLEYTPKNFPIFRKQRTLCFNCVVGRKEARRAQRNARNRDTMDKSEEALVNAFCAKVRAGGLKGGAKVPHSAELLESIMTFYGGVDGFAAMLMKHFWASPSGGQQRGKVLEMISKLVTANADQGGSKIPLSLWTEEELEKELEERLKETAAGFAIPEELFSRKIEEPTE